MATLKDKAQEILDEKVAKILPENIKEGVQVWDVVGTLKEKIDTSDANATSNDIWAGKTAYVNGEKVTGTLYESTFSAFNVGITAEPLSNENRTRVICEDLGKVNLPTIIPQNAGLALDIDNNVLAQVIELTPEKIVEGNTILGIEGAATSDVDAVAFAFPKLATYINNAVNFPDYLYLPEIKDVISDESMVQFEYIDDLGATQFLSALPLGIPYAEIFKLFPYVFVSVREYYTTVPEAYNYAVSIWFDKNPFKIAISKRETVDSEGNPVTEITYTPTLLASQVCIGTISYYCSFDEFVEIVPNNFVEQCSLGIVEKSMSSGLTSSTGTIDGEHVALYGNVIIEDNTGENLFNFI